MILEKMVIVNLHVIFMLDCCGHIRFINSYKMVFNIIRVYLYQKPTRKAIDR